MRRLHQCSVGPINFILALWFRQEARKDLESDHGDPITTLNAYKEWLELKRGQFNRKHENPKQWCRRRGLEEQRFYEITKLRNQFQDLLRDCDLMKMNEQELNASERIIRKGELRQLKDLKRAHRYEAPRKRKLKKMDVYNADDGEDADDGKVDIRDVDFRLSHDASKIDVNILSNSVSRSVLFDDFHLSLCRVWYRAQLPAATEI